MEARKPTELVEQQQTDDEKIVPAAEGDQNFQTTENDSSLELPNVCFIYHYKVNLKKSIVLCLIDFFLFIYDSSFTS